MRYDPLIAPDPGAWLALGEGEQLATVLRDHEREEVEEGRFRMHAVIHSGIETQLAEGHTSACAALARLLDAGLDRHEAVHALGSVLASHIHRTMKRKEFECDQYNGDLDELTVESWHALAEEQ